MAEEKRQFLDDQRQRYAVAGKIGQGKQPFGLGLIREKLAITHWVGYKCEQGVRLAIATLLSANIPMMSQDSSRNPGGLRGSNLGTAVHHHCSQEWAHRCTGAIAVAVDVLTRLRMEKVRDWIKQRWRAAQAQSARIQLLGALFDLHVITGNWIQPGQLFKPTIAAA